MTIFSRLRLPLPSRHKERQKKRPGGPWQPPRYVSGVMPPFVFSAENPWGWLEYHNGNFQGQQLALKRSIITLGRAEDSDIWLDDDMASRRHAEVAWEQNIVYLTDCNSLNSTRLNGRRVQGSVPLSSGDIIEIGTQRFLFLLAEQKTTTDQYDPLVNHKWHSAFELQESRETTQYNVALPSTIPLANMGQVNTDAQSQRVESDKLYTPPKALHSNGPMPLRLPSRPKGTE